MTLSWRSVFAASPDLLLGVAISSAQEPKKEAEPKKKAAAKKEPAKKEVEKKDIEIRIVRVQSVSIPGYMPGIAYGWNYYWPGPVLPGMWGNGWGGLWPYSWWMGGPWNYGVGNGWGFHGGVYPVILPPVFGPVGYPAVSPFWTPYVAPYWSVPAPAWPVIVGTDDRPSRKTPEFRAVPASATADKLFADALWLFSDDNFTSARDHLSAALKQSPRDARLWYFKALTERAMKDEKAATNSAENGAALEIMGLTDRRSILVSLERIQGADRVFLTDKVSGSKALTLAAAADRVAKLNSPEVTTVASTGR